MDEATVGDAAPDAQQGASTPEPPATLSAGHAPPSSNSLLSDAPTTDPSDPADEQPKRKVSEPTADNPPVVAAVYAANIGTVPHSRPDKDANAATTGTAPGWEAAREQVMRDMATSEKLTTQSPAGEAGSAKRGARGGKRATLVHGTPMADRTGGEESGATPGSSGRGRGGGRPRGRGRGAGRGGKRKREDGSDDHSSDSEVATPAVTMTKSGRSIQRPTSFVPPPPSPTTTTKRKRTYRRNPESAVCKMCLRGTSPASNMIVFCDGCNTPYHRYCHQPPIDQAVIDEVDKEWYCKPCEKERIVPVPESDLADFVSAKGAPYEQRQKYFASLPPGMLVTLLTRATTLRPDLPLFGPDFEARANANATANALPKATPTNGQPTLSAASSRQQIPPPTFPPRQHSGFVPPQVQAYADDTRYPVPHEHPAHYVRPGQGLMRNLPPEREDTQYLVDDDRYQVFSHYHIDPRTANANANTNVGFGHSGPGRGSMVTGTGMGMGMGPAMGGA